jgi:hypothetical protein
MFMLRMLAGNLLMRQMLATYGPLEVLGLWQ